MTKINMLMMCISFIKPKYTPIRERYDNKKNYFFDNKILFNPNHKPHPKKVEDCRKIYADFFTKLHYKNFNIESCSFQGENYDRVQIPPNDGYLPHHLDLYLKEKGLMPHLEKGSPWTLYSKQNKAIWVSYAIDRQSTTQDIILTTKRPIEKTPTKQLEAMVA